MNNEQTLFMKECRFYYPDMTVEDYEKVIRALGNRTDNIVKRVMFGELKLKPVPERTREYIFDILGIKE